MGQMQMQGGAGGAMMQQNPMGSIQVPNLENVVPATPQEVEEFLILNPVDESAQQSFRKMDPRGQRMVINRGVMSGARDPTAAFIGRMNSVRKIITGGVQLAPGDWLCPGCGDVQFGRNAACRRCGIGKPEGIAAASSMVSATAPAAQGMQQGQVIPGNGQPSFFQDTVPATPEEVEQFLTVNPVQPHAGDKFRAMNPQLQRMVINRGGMDGARDPTAAFIGRIVKMEKTINGQVYIPPGDWLCSSCGDHIYSRNEHCRRCGTSKPTNLPDAQTAMAMQQQQAQMQAQQMQMQMQVPQMQMQMLM